VQIVGYEPALEEPAALLISEDGNLARESLEAGRSLSFGLESRHCAGAVDDETHRRCPVEDAPYCSAHTSTWPCARCTGGCSMPIEACHEPHAVYLAAFAPDVFKVGVTRQWRVETRLREQGADRAVRIFDVANGRIARQLEAEIAEEITDRVRLPSKIEGLDQCVETAAWDAVLDSHELLDTYEFDYGLELDQQPIEATLATGSVRGTKGRLLVLESDGTTYVVDMRKLVGYELSSDPSTADRQRSLDSFEQ